jgi:cobalt/nickel transport system permease protein
MSVSPGDLINLLRPLRVPVLLIDLLTLCHRFIFVLLESAGTIRIAQLSRGGYSSPARGLRSYALLAANLFVNALARARRLHQAMLGRGYRGRLGVLPQVYRWDARLFFLSLLVLGSLVGVWRWS